MTNQFVSYKVALQLEALGFEEKCLSFYNHPSTGYMPYVSHHMDIRGIEKSKIESHGVLAPLWQQAVEWLRKKFKIEAGVKTLAVNDYQPNIREFDKEGIIGSLYLTCNKTSYEEALRESVLKVVEIVNKRK